MITENKIHQVISLLIELFIHINIIKPGDIFIEYKRETIFIRYYNVIEVSVTVNLKSEKVLVIIYLAKDTVISLLIYFTILVEGVKLRPLL